ncbi:MAG TPA: hypothetical protein DCY79_26145 [Planctomycetaceae bacterium]|nr:hypothetical protein [Blastopirellula sp.]HAY83303.1 hypothetical protein [Planctomycetaceae bacterium]
MPASSRLACWPLRQRSSWFLALAVTACSGTALFAAPPAQWVSSYDAGYRDRQGAYAGGSEIMHLAAHQKRLFAANGYWMDARWTIPPEGHKQSAQVLRLDSAKGEWQVDLDTGQANDLGLEYMKGNILKSVTFTRDATGQPLAEPKSLLVLAAGARFDRGGAVSAWVRNDTQGKWHHTLVRHGPAVGGVRWLPRDMQVYRDTVTGLEHLFLLLGNPGVITGQYDPQHPGQIRWSRHTEFPFLQRGAFRSRPLGMVQANGSLFFSVDDAIYQRIDGPRPTWQEVIHLGDDIDTDVGGVRGLTAVPNPHGNGDSLLFAWAPGGRSTAQILRLDPDGQGGFTRHEEVSIADLMSRHLQVRVSYALAAHNMMYPVTHPTSGKTVHLIGFLGNIHGADHLRWPGSAVYGGGMYAIRHSPGEYTLHEVNNAYHRGKLPLVSPRTFCRSPFGDHQLYIAGHDASNRISDNLAWVFQAPLSVALGERGGKAWTEPQRPSKIAPHLQRGPVYELRTYVAAKDRFQHLVKRFREHTDRLFRKHNMQPLGYWTPAAGPPINQQTLVYLLKHPSRYAAWKNWVAFHNDREWQRVLDEPVFQRLLIGTPESVFLTSVDESLEDLPTHQHSEAMYELTTHTTKPEQLPLLVKQFETHLANRTAHRPGQHLATWKPFDPPASANQLISLVRRVRTPPADARPSGKPDLDFWSPATVQQSTGKSLLSQPTQTRHLRPLDLSRK